MYLLYRAKTDTFACLLIRVYGGYLTIYSFTQFKKIDCYDYKKDLKHAPCKFYNVQFNRIR